MYFQVLNLENAKKDMFRDKQRTKNVPAMFFDVTVLIEKRSIVLLGFVKGQGR